MASENNLSSHSETYGGFLTFLKWGSIAAVLAVAVVVALIV